MIIDCQRCGLTEGRWIDNGEHGLGSALACERCGAFIKPLRFKVEEAEPEYAGRVPYAPDREGLWEIGGSLPVLTMLSPLTRRALVATLRRP